MACVCPITRTAIWRLRPSSPFGLRHIAETLPAGAVDGAGGMGQVYRALDTQLHRPVAVNFSRPNSPRSATPAAVPPRGAGGRADQPSRDCQIYYVGEQEGVTFIAMELVEGKTVRELIQAQELDLLGALDIAIQVADGLGKAHELGIVHRDVKPPNVMLTRDGHVKILDFGLAKLLDRRPGSGSGAMPELDLTKAAATQSGMVMGTPAYMSPEQIRGTPVDHRATSFPWAFCSMRWPPPSRPSSARVSWTHCTRWPLMKPRRCILGESLFRLNCSASSTVA